jgi:hypothetical protein
MRAELAAVRERAAQTYSGQQSRPVPSKEAVMGSRDKCEKCNSIKVEASFGPHGFRMLCLVCGLSVEMDDLLEPVTRPGEATVAA